MLDSWSIIAYLEDEPAGERVAGVIADAHESGIPLLMAIVNVGEVWYILARETSESEADQKIKCPTRTVSPPLLQNNGKPTSSQEIRNLNR